MQFIYYNNCVPLSPTSPWLGVFRHVNPSYSLTMYSEEVGLKYSMKDAFSASDVELFVRLAPVLRCQIHMTRTKVVDGLFIELFLTHGRDLLPTKMEGLFVMKWERLYAGTPLVDLLRKPVSAIEIPKVLVPKYVFGEYQGPSSEDVKFFPGIFCGEPGLTIGDSLYVFSPSRLTDSVMNVPLAVNHAFFARRPRLEAPLQREETYSSEATLYSMHYHEKHLNQLERILELFPEAGYIEPGCGAGIVVRLKSDVVAGDPFPPAYAHPLVVKESFRQTLDRGRLDMIVVCSYIHTFLTDEDLRMLEGRQVIWVDSPDHQCPGRLVFPGVWIENIPYTPQSFILEKPIVGSLSFTENLLNHKIFALFRESEYSLYLRVMRPNMAFAHLPSYTGGYISSVIDSDAPVLCTSVRDVLYAQFHYPDRQIYFSEIGRIFTGFATETDIMAGVGYCKVYYCTRVVYRVPKISPYASIIDYSPHVVVGDWFYFYDRTDAGVVRRFKYVTSTHFVKGEVEVVASLCRDQLSVEVTENGRVYLRNKVVSFSYLFDGTDSGYRRFFYSFFSVGMTRQQFGEVSRGMSRLVLPEHRASISQIRQRLEVSDLSSSSILRICAELPA